MSTGKSKSIQSEQHDGRTVTCPVCKRDNPLRQDEFDQVRQRGKAIYPCRKCSAKFRIVFESDNTLRFEALGAASSHSNTGHAEQEHANAGDAEQNESTNQSQVMEAEAKALHGAIAPQIETFHERVRELFDKALQELNQYERELKKYEESLEFSTTMGGEIGVSGIDRVKKMQQESNQFLQGIHTWTKTVHKNTTVVSKLLKEVTEQVKSVSSALGGLAAHDASSTGVPAPRAESQSVDVSDGSAAKVASAVLAQMSADYARFLHRNVIIGRLPELFDLVEVELNHLRRSENGGHSEEVRQHVIATLSKIWERIENWQQRCGLNRFPQVGESFELVKHEKFGVEETDDGAKFDRVKEIVRSGYVIDEEVLRRAKVVVWVEPRRAERAGD
jgi:hypothetical protein